MGLLTASNRVEREKATPTFDETIALLDGAGVKSASGIYVNSTSAMKQATVYACVRAVSEIIAQFPIEVQTRSGGAWVASDMHDLYGLIAEPNDWQTQHDFISNMVAWSELEGNSYYYKIKNGAGDIKKMIPIEGRFVDTQIMRDMSVDYQITSEEFGISGTYKKDRVFHLRNFGTQGYKGLSTISQHKEGIGLALQLESHGVSAYKSGLQSNKWVKTETPMKGDQLTQFKKDLAEYQGATRAGKMPIASGWDIHEFKGISQTDAQYIESRKLQKEEIATMFLVPIFILNSTDNTTWGSGLEQIMKTFVRVSLNPRMNRLGQTMVRELIPEKERLSTRIMFDTRQFTLGEFKERMDGYRAGVESGVYNPDECRDIEGKPPRADGDKYRIPANISIEGEQNELQDAEPTV